ncbi:MAG TPA: alpha/beta fold hydrolase [Woeseiaceae bacterium]|nr:alpha/beta fold hydrolase [Woeseiaceae bacterium]
MVLLHGLVRTASSMETMSDALVTAGYLTYNVDYPSRDYTIEELAPLAVEEGLAGCRAQGDVDTIHFVAHSLGGILVRQYLSEFDISGLGRVVMLGPPNQGSLAADKMRNVPGYDWINGPAGHELGKGDESVPLKLGPANFEVGIIAGNRSIDPITSAFLPNPDDGRVSVEDTKLEGMAGFVVVEHSHAFMMRMHDVIELTIRFLRTGSFDEL